MSDGDPTRTRVIIIGAGFGGIGLGIKLKAAGLNDFVILEKSQQIGAVPYPSVSVLSVVLVALGTVLLANIVAAVPARTAARTPTALMLRAE